MLLISILIPCLLLICKCIVKCDYIRSDLIILNDDVPVGAELVNLNKLISNQKIQDIDESSKSTNNKKESYLFKLVNDVPFISYINLKSVIDNSDQSIQSTIVELVKPIDYKKMCVNRETNCLFSLKIIAINQNDFIEIPIELRKASSLSPSSLSTLSLVSTSSAFATTSALVNDDNADESNKQKFRLRFNQPNLVLKLTLEKNKFLIDSAGLYNYHETKKQRKRLFNQTIENSIVYRLTPVDTTSDFDILLSKQFDNETQTFKLKLETYFKSQQSLIEAFNTKKVFKYKLEAYVNKVDNLIGKYGQIKNASLNIEFNLNELNLDDLIESLKPLEFEYPIYTTSITDNLTSETVLIQPKLKSPNNKILFSLFQSGKNESIVATSLSNQDDIPFLINESNGSIRLKVPSWKIDLFNNTSSMYERTYLFGIKATYKRLVYLKENNFINKLNETKLNYYYDYIIPAFAKIQITIRHIPSKSPFIKIEPNDSVISAFDFTNDANINKTLFLNIYEPMRPDSVLVKFKLQELNANSDDARIRQINYDWLTNFDQNLFSFTKLDNNTFQLSVLTQLKDKSLYKINLKQIEKLLNGKRNGSILNEIKIELNVDFDPFIFEKSEYAVKLTEKVIIGQNLIRVSIKTNPNLNKTNETDLFLPQASRNIKYRILNDNEYFLDTYQTSDDDSETSYFQIDSTSGWLSVKKQILNKNYFEFNVMATNVEQQKTKLVKVKISLECSLLSTPTTTISTNKQLTSDRILKFNIYENMPNQTQIGTLETICSNLSLRYDLDDLVLVKVCDLSIDNCTNFQLHLSNSSSATSFIRIDSITGNLISNDLLNKKLIVDLLKLESSDVNELRISLGLIVFVKNSLNYMIQTKYLVEINLQSEPKLLNFYNGLILTEYTNETFENELSSRIDEGESSESSNCLYKYKPNIDFEQSELDDINYSPNLIRFIKVDQNSAHLQAEYNLGDCSASFFIHNNGCLSLKFDQINQNVCGTGLTNETDYLILKSGNYLIEFKLCNYNNNKVSCSQFYQQKILVSKDIYKSTRIQTSLLINENRINSTGQFILKSIVSNTYFVLVISILASVCAIILFVILIGIIKTRFTKNRKYKSAEMAFVLPIKQSIDLKNSETSSESGSNLRTNTHTPETSSNSATTTSKLSKTDEDTDEVVKIRVSDDFFTMEKNFSTTKYAYSNNNFSYAGSFSSIDSSCGSTESVTGEDLNPFKPNGSKQTTPNACTEKQQGLYSVKNASIQYNMRKLSSNLNGTNNESNSTTTTTILTAENNIKDHNQQKDFEIYNKPEVNLVLNSNDNTNKNVYKTLSINLNEFSLNTQQNVYRPSANQLKDSNSPSNLNMLLMQQQQQQHQYNEQQIQQQQQQQQQLQQQAIQTKSSSLKKIKKDSILKRNSNLSYSNNLTVMNDLINSNANSSNLNNLIIENCNNNINSSSSNSSTSSSSSNSSNYHYLSSKEILLIPEEVIASVV